MVINKDSFAAAFQKSSSNDCSCTGSPSSANHHIAIAILGAPTRQKYIVTITRENYVFNRVS